MIVKLKVIDPNGLKDKVTGALLTEGATLETSDLDRVNNLVSRKLCEITSVEAQKEQNTGSNLVPFNENEYELAIVKEALDSIGASVSKNAGVPATTKKISELTEEQTQALIEALTKE